MKRILLLLFGLTVFGSKAEKKKNLVKLQTRKVIAEIADNASGLTWYSPGEKLFMVVNNPPELCRLSASGDFEARIPLTEMDDTEGVAWCGGRKFAVVQERERVLTTFELNESLDGIVPGTVKNLLVDKEKAKNKGLEGLCYRPEKKEFWIVKEKKPRRIYRIPEKAVEEGTEKGSFAVANWGDFGGLKDLAGIACTEEGVLLLSDDSAALVFTDFEGAVRKRVELKAGMNGLGEDVPQAEGICIGKDGALYILSEPNILYIFKKAEKVDVKVD